MKKEIWGILVSFLVLVIVLVFVAFKYLDSFKPLPPTPNYKIENLPENSYTHIDIPCKEPDCKLRAKM